MSTFNAKICVGLILEALTPNLLKSMETSAVFGRASNRLTELFPAM